ncbi:hypothetical protein [Nakamurella aerolata]|uniref:Dolichyl-phosphate-mannose-protein mannosyltransferase n=1 Tax=Nakamurella aerolata TaxID=1656892 RepID=A0A849AAV1_9ACTN|nr:hypothetical protein [Nakamurella aerolata]NNG36268.1 hypothetical protein [Nakamurella aerolata]
MTLPGGRPPAGQQRVTDPVRFLPLLTVTRLVAPILLMFAAIALATGFTQVQLPNSHEVAHLDYACQVWNGRLPVFENGLLLQVEKSPPVQWTAQHPPLFYLLAAPFVGPLLAAGHPETANLVGRSLNTVIAVVALIAIAWAISRIAPGQRARSWTYIGTAVAAAVSPLIRVAAFYNDELAVVFIALGSGIAATVLWAGLTARRLTAAAVVAVGLLLTRANTVIMVALLVLAVAIAGWRGAQGGQARRWLAAGLAGAVPALAAAAGAGWFYLRNIRLTGGWTGGHPDWAAENLGRHQLSVWHIIRTDPSLGLWQPQWFTHASARVFHPYFEIGRGAAAVAMAAGVIGAAVLLVRALRRRAVTWQLIAVVGVVAAQFVGTYAMFVLYRTGTGGSAARYFLPALLGFALLVACGLMALPVRWRRWGLALLLVAALLPGVQWLYRYQWGFGWSLNQNTAGGVPVPIVMALMVAFAVGLVIVVAQMPTEPAPRPWRSTDDAPASTVPAPAGSAPAVPAPTGSQFTVPPTDGPDPVAHPPSAAHRAADPIRSAEGGRLA